MPYPMSNVGKKKVLDNRQRTALNTPVWESRHVVLLVSLAFPSLRLAQAQRQAKIHKIGVLRPSPLILPLNGLFLRAFRELGYVPGQEHPAFETRSAVA